MKAQKIMIVIAILTLLYITSSEAELNITNLYVSTNESDSNLFINGSVIINAIQAKPNTIIIESLNSTARIDNQNNSHTTIIELLNLTSPNNDVKQDGTTITFTEQTNVNATITSGGYIEIGDFEVPTTIEGRNELGGSGGLHCSGDNELKYINGNLLCVPTINITLPQLPPINATLTNVSISWPLQLFNITWTNKKTLREGENTLTFNIEKNTPISPDGAIALVSEDCTEPITYEPLMTSENNANQWSAIINLPELPRGDYCLTILTYSDEHYEITNFWTDITEKPWWLKIIERTIKGLQYLTGNAYTIITSAIRQTYNWAR